MPNNFNLLSDSSSKEMGPRTSGANHHTEKEKKSLTPVGFEEQITVALIELRGQMGAGRGK